MRKPLSQLTIAVSLLMPLSGRAEERKPALTAIAVAPDGKGVVYGSQAGLFFRAFDRAEPRRLASQMEHIHGAAFSADGKRLAVAGGSPGQHGSIELYDWPRAELQSQLEGHQDVVFDVVWIGDKLAAASADRTISLWDTKEKRQVATLKGHSRPVVALAVSPDRNMLCSASADNTIRVWQMPSGKLLRSLTNHLGPVHGLAFRPPGETQAPFVLASVSADGTLRIWQPAIGRLVRIVRHPAPVFCVAWSHDGKYVITGAKDRTLRVIEGDSDDVLKTMKTSSGWPISIAAPDDRIIAGTSTGALSVFQIGKIEPRKQRG
ncbi:MAG: hypothetical protein KatS3mg105_1740 [Gemmatales bacterium]|nr:MAG: hypothetical protein KatS3mg105_1740 [Gemmatales bacterium]